MNSPSGALLSQQLFTFQYPTLLQTVMCLGGHLILGYKDSTTLSWWQRRLLHFSSGIIWFVFHQAMPNAVEFGNESFLAITNDIRSVVAIVKEGFLVLNVTEAFLSKKLAGGLKRNTFDDLLLDTGE